VLEADVIISIPKLKTHEKVGITCALKGTVGAVGRKECLAHYRQGSPEKQGDEYSRSGLIRDLSSQMCEKACELGVDVVSNVYRITSKLLSRAMRLGKNGATYGAWYGNDTAWRMVLDIPRILRFASVHGDISEVPIRKHLALVDGVCAGEGEGPLMPTPRHCGVVIFGPDICSVDAVCAYVMGFDPKKIKMVANSFKCRSYPITTNGKNDLAMILNGKSADVQEVIRHFTPYFIPQKGWTGTIEADLPLL
jgi:hypothetical protein